MERLCVDSLWPSLIPHQSYLDQQDELCAVLVVIKRSINWVRVRYWGMHNQQCNNTTLYFGLWQPFRHFSSSFKACSRCLCCRDCTAPITLTRLQSTSCSQISDCKETFRNRVWHSLKSLCWSCIIIICDGIMSWKKLQFVAFKKTFNNLSFPPSLQSFQFGITRTQRKSAHIPTRVSIQSTALST